MSDRMTLVQNKKECLESINWIPVSERLPEIKMDYEECYEVK